MTRSETTPALTEFERHCRSVVRALARGDVVPLLGAGANLCDRPAGATWEPGRYLPTGGELARHLAAEVDYPLADIDDLVRVSEYFDLRAGGGPLYERLHEVFASDYPPTSLHRLLARLPATFAASAARARHLLVVTTNYDDTLERAFADAGEPYDVVLYRATEPGRGRFVHVAPDAPAHLIRRPNEYQGVSLDERSVVLKIHGAIDRADESEDSFVITEDDYIEYLTHTSLNRLVPAPLLAKLLRCHFLFLGYRLRDWNLRVILHRIWAERHDLGYHSWSIQRDVDPLDREHWRRRDVDVYDVPLAEYVAELERQIAAWSEAQ